MSCHDLTRVLARQGRQVVVTRVRHARRHLPFPHSRPPDPFDRRRPPSVSVSIGKPPVTNLQVVKPERIQEKETKPNIRPKGKTKGKLDGN